MDRRKFIGNSLAASAAIGFGIHGRVALAGTEVGTVSDDGTAPLIGDAKLRGIIPDLRQSVKVPIIIRAVERIKVGKHFLVVVRSEDGVVGVCQGNSRLNNTTTIFDNQVKPFFLGKDARDIESLIEKVYVFRRNYKYAGMPLWNAVAVVELAVLDLVGKTAGKPVYQLLGKPLRKTIPVYMSSTERKTTAEEEVEWVGERIRQTGSKAAKIKIGARMNFNADVYPGRSEQLIRLARKSWGDEFHLYADSNGSYDVPKAIEMGKFLQRYNVGFYEEPVPWEDFVGTKQVADALDMVVAGGEQDSSMPKWQWFMDNQAFRLLQPDLLYNGGMIRTMKVAAMARQAGIDVTLHSPKNNPLAAYMLHFAAITENLGPYQEFRAKLPKHSQDYYTPNLQVVNGEVAVPSGPGFGIKYDPDIIKNV